MKTFIHKYLFIAVILTATVLPCVAVNITNTIPFTNSFEQYSHNQNIAGTNGWFANNTNALIVVTNATDMYDAFLGELPLTNATHTRILVLDGNATNKISNSMNDFFIDMMIQPKRWNEEDHPAVPTDAMRTAFYFNTNGHLMVYGAYEETGTMKTNWCQMSGTTVGTGQWVRLTVDLRTGESGGQEWFRVMLNNQELDYEFGASLRGIPDNTPGPWLQIGNKAYGQSTLHTISGITLSGTGQFDDLQVVTNNPAGNVFYNIDISIGPKNGAKVTVASLFNTTASATTPFKVDDVPFNIEIIPFPSGSAYNLTGVWYDSTPQTFFPDIGSIPITISNACNHTVTVTVEAMPQELTIAKTGLASICSPVTGVYPTEHLYGEQVNMLSTDPNPTNNSLTRHSCAWSRVGSDDLSGETAGAASVNNSFTITEQTTHTWNWHVEHSLTANKVSQYGSYTGTDGILNVNPITWHNEGSNVVVIATPSDPAAGTWSFDSWSGDTADSVTNANQITLTMDNANTNLIANFIYTPNSSNWTLTVASANGTAVPDGTISNIIDGTVTNCIANQDIAAGSGTQLHCIGWTGTGSAPSSGSTTDTGLFLVTTNSSVTWNWITQYELTMTVVGNGSVDVTAGISWQTANESITITATPDSGSTFAGWTGTNATDTVISSNQINILMGTKRSITATFTGGTTQTQTTHGTPYTWLDQFGLTSHDADDLIDQDSDGLLTWEEYITGTDPIDSNSVFRVLNIQTLGGTNYLTFYGTTNGVTLPFGIERSTNLVTGDGWQLYSTKNRESSGTNLWMDPAPPAAGIPVFYRPVATNQ